MYLYHLSIDHVIGYRIFGGIDSVIFETLVR